MERMKCVVVACAAAVGLAAGAFADTINLATVTKPTVAKNGDVIKGTMVGGKKITIAKGAKVTLKDVKINDKFDYADAGLYAGITCEGNATIVLEGENVVNSLEYDYPGIFVPKGSTLRIEGFGRLSVQGLGNAAGIGGAYQMDCGNIVIAGGTIEATGTGNVAEYPLAVDDPDGITIIAEEYNPNRFFRIRVDVAP